MYALRVTNTATMAMNTEAKPKDTAMVSLVETKWNRKSLDKAEVKVDKRIMYFSQVCSQTSKRCRRVLKIK